MNKKYYVKIGSDRVDGPFTLREAEKERNWWDRFGEKSIVLKLVINEEGKEVK